MVTLTSLQGQTKWWTNLPNLLRQKEHAVTFSFSIFQLAATKLKHGYKLPGQEEQKILQGPDRQTQDSRERDVKTAQLKFFKQKRYTQGRERAGSPEPPEVGRGQCGDLTKQKMIESVF